MKNRDKQAKLVRSAQSPTIEPCERRLLMSTYTVTTLSDAVAPVAGQLTLRQAIMDANAHAGADTVAFSSTVFSPGAQHTIKLMQGQLNITGDTTIQGPGQTTLAIDANHASRVMQVSSGVSVSISDVTLTNGLVTSAAGQLAVGGGVLNAGTLKLTSVTVSNNEAAGGTYSSQDSYAVPAGSASGGGIYSTGSLNLVSSTISGNTARGGAAYYGWDGNSSGGGIFSGGALTISSSFIANNVAASGAIDTTQDGDGGESDGGGIYATSSLTISSSTIADNYANGGDGTAYASSFASAGPGNGGGVFTSGSSSFTSDTFAGNQATGGNGGGGGSVGSPASGGAIFASASAVITGSTFQNNSALGGDGAFDDSGAGGNASGGAINALGSLNVSNSSILFNRAIGGIGAPAQDVLNSNGLGGGIDSALSLTLINSTVSGNTAEAGQGGNGGGPYGASGGAGEGGAVYLAGTATVSNSTLSGNSVLGGPGENPYHGGTGGSGGDGNGGAVYNNAALTLTNSTLANNSAVGGAGGSSYEGDGGSGADGSGSAIYSVNSVTVYDSTITGNTTAGGVGGTTGSSFDYTNGGDGTGSAAVRIAGTLTGTDALRNSIIAGNLANGSTEDDLYGDISTTNTGYDLVGTGSGLPNGVNGNIVDVNNPMLSPLANNGGPTQTMLPVYNSPAVNAGGNSLVPTGVTTDQRGYARIVGGRVDIGAVELQSASISGTVFNDANGDGVRESGENGLAGVTVYADLPNKGAYQSGDPTAVTNSSGNYTLNGVPEGAVIVRQNLPGGYRQSYPTGGTGEHINLTPAGVNGALFADSTRLYISGTVTLNGVGESGVVVYADLNHDGKFESNENNKTTVGDGSFAFQSLAAGTYTFRIVPPAGQTLSGNSAITVTLGSGGVDQNLIFSLAKPTITKLTGTPIGTAGSYRNHGTTIANAFDGNLTTFFDGPDATGDWVGLDLGSAKVVTQVQYAPRAGYETRMIGGEIQASNSANFSSGVVTLLTIKSAPAANVLSSQTLGNSTAYRYYRYLGPAGSYCDISELAFLG